MKRVILAAAFVMAVFASGTAFAGDDRPVTFDRLPEAAQQFIKKYFGDRKISYSVQDTDWFDGDYEVRFAGGGKISFRRDGSWEEVECKGTHVPAGIVPEGIAGYVARRHPDTRIVGIGRDSRGYEIKLSDGAEIKFDRKGHPYGYDR